MPTEYKFRLKSPVGVLTNEFVDVKSFAYTKEVNAAGFMTVDVDSNHTLTAAVDDSLDNIIEVWRRNQAAGLDWYCDFRGLYRGELRQADADGLVTRRLYFPGPLHLLGRPGIAYRGGVANRTQFDNVPVETIMNTLVKYNATASGTTGDGRALNVTLTRVAVEADGGYGTAIQYSCPKRYLLEVLQGLCRMAPGDFDLVYTGSGQWEYRFYAGQLGADRRATVKFALPWGNMANPVYEKNRINERTVAIVFGPGQEADASIRVRTPVYGNYEAEYNAAELLVDGRSALLSAAVDDELDAIGDAAIWEARAEARLSFQVLQTRGYVYGRDYNLGDLVTGTFEEINKDLKVGLVTVTMDGSGDEQVQVEMRDA